MKKTAYFIGGIALYIGMALVFSSYGNVLAHRNINKGIVEKFKTRFLGSSDNIEFKNYSFLFNSSVGYEGEMITKGGKFSVTEEKRSLSAEEWIIEGGFSADEPQLQASLRHFYDPTIEDPNERYLTDQLGIIMSAESPTFNPRIDHIAWATGEAEHLYNWKIGKAKLKKALETNDVRERKTLMAYAWRSLGETLHMIADMGCPAHVRDDAHPGLFDDYSTIKHFGNSDPYENICEQLTDQMVGWSAGAVDSGLKDFFFEANTVQEIAHELAAYTNKNFFTDQTISGRNVAPRIHPEKTYPSPKLEDCIYDPINFTYTKKISGHDVIMCRDKSYAMPHNAHIDRVCVESQAAALMPQIAEAGANVIKLFIPKLRIVIEELDENSIKGRVIHTTNAEYKNEILYNGEIELINSASSKKLGVIDCIDGEFNNSHSINSKDIDEDSDGLAARILFGGITVKSEVKRMGEIDFSPPFVYFHVANSERLFQVSNRIRYSSTDIENFSGKLVWDGLSFSANYVEEHSFANADGGTNSYTLTGSFYGEIASDFSKMDFYGKTIEEEISNGKLAGEPTEWVITWVHEIGGKNVPLTRVPFNGSLSGINIGKGNNDLVNCITVVRDSYTKYTNGELGTNWDESITNLNDPSIILNFKFGVSID